MPHSTATEIRSRYYWEVDPRESVDIEQARNVYRELLQQYREEIASYHNFNPHVLHTPPSISDKIKTMWERSNWFNRKKIEAAKVLALKKKKPYYRTHERW